MFLYKVKVCAIRVFFFTILPVQKINRLQLKFEEIIE